MAFGSWLKGLVSTVGSAIGKALPVAKKVVDTVAPVAQKVGGIIGGKIGSGIQKATGLATDFVNGTQKMLGSKNPGTSFLGSGGAGIRHIIPRFK